MAKFREIKLKTGAKILLGKNAENNDELVKKFKGKLNVILHTVAPGSPFCVIDESNPSRETLSLSGAYCAKYSQDWRDNKSDVRIHQFTGKEVKKPFFTKKGTWKIIKNPKVIRIKKEDIKNLK
ncbi:MAG: NFACT RNA binding domain-containing protein [archaeon]